MSVYGCEITIRKHEIDSTDVAKTAEVKLCRIADE